MRAFCLLSVVFLSLFANVEEAREKLLLQLSGEWVARGLYVVNKLEIADLLDEGPKGVEELAHQAGCDAGFLERVMHMLASNGIFEEAEAHVYGNNEASALLMRGHPSSLKSIAEFYGEEVHRSVDAMLDGVQKGKTAFNLVYGQPVFPYFKENPDRMKLFQTAMREKSKAVIESAIEVYPFGKYEKVCDIGGGNGAFLRAITGRFPGVKGVLLELPEVVAQVKGAPFECVAGDFFTSIPEGCDLYFMKSILHDWNDENAKLIVRNCAKAMKEGSRLLIIDAVLMPGDSSIYANAMDIVMMTVAGGKERYLSEFEALLKEEGLEVEAVYKTSTEFSIIEARKA